MGVDYDTFMEHNPFELKAYIEAYKLKRAMYDERDWTMGLYVKKAVEDVMRCALSKGSTKPTYPEKPMLSGDLDNTEKDPEANERLAALEMEQWINLLKKQSTLPETIMADI